MTKSKQKTCAWCTEVFKSTKDHLMHLHEAHSENVGRGATRTRTWSCWRCASDVAASRKSCDCGFVHPYAVDEDN